MNAYEVQQYVKGLMVEHGLEGWSFEWERSKRRLGRCIYDRKVLGFSDHLPNLTEEYVRNIALHEIAHALVGPGHGHDWIWKMFARRIGCDAERCQDLPPELKPKGKWIISCACGAVTDTRHKHPPRKRTYLIQCNTCGEYNAHYGKKVSPMKVMAA